MPQESDSLRLIITVSPTRESVSATLFRSHWRPHVGLRSLPVTPVGAPPVLVPPRPRGIREEVWLAYWAAAGLFLKVEKAIITEVAAEQLLLWDEATPPA